MDRFECSCYLCQGHSHESNEHVESKAEDAEEHREVDLSVVDPTSYSSPIAHKTEPDRDWKGVRSMTDETWIDSPSKPMVIRRTTAQKTLIVVELRESQVK